MKTPVVLLSVVAAAYGCGGPGSVSDEPAPDAASSLSDAADPGSVDSGPTGEADAAGLDAGAADASAVDAARVDAGTVDAGGAAHCRSAGAGAYDGEAFVAPGDSFEATWDVTPSNGGSPVDAALVLGSEPPPDPSWDSFATLVLFNASGAIQARSAGAYRADLPIAYASGAVHRVRLVVDVASHSYSVFVTAPGGSEQPLATGYAFRTSQQSVPSLNHWGVKSAAGALQACLLSIRPAAAPLSISPLTATAVAGELVSFTARGGTPGLGYQWSLTRSGSGQPTLTAGGAANATGTYMAGDLSGTDEIQVCDRAAAPACVRATVSVASSTVSCTRQVTHDGTGTDCSATAPCGHIMTAVVQLTPGDTLCIHGGATQSGEAIWDEYINLGTGSIRGTAQAPITIAAYPGDQVVLTGIHDGQRVLYLDGGTLVAMDTDPASDCYYGHCRPTAPSHLVFRDLVFDGSNGARNGVIQIENAHHLVFENVEVRNGPMQGIHNLGDYSQCINCVVHDNGIGATFDGVHGVYLTNSHVTFRGGRIFHNEDQAVHVWCGAYGRDCSFNTFDGVELFDNNVSGVGPGGLNIATGYGNVVKNNVVHDFVGNSGIVVDCGAWNTEVVGNTVYSNPGPGIRIGTIMSNGCTGVPYSASYPAPGGSPVPHKDPPAGTRVENNVLWGNGSAGAADCGGTGQIADYGSGTVCTGNRIGP